MGSRGVDAVCDAGPLIHLNEADCLSLLSIFDHVHVPEAVWSETIGQHRVREADILQTSVIERHTSSAQEAARFVARNLLENLHTGEKECLFLCQKLGVPVLLTDDLAVRDVARWSNLTPVGSLGVVVRAFQIGQLSYSQAEKHILELYERSSLFVTRTIVELAIEQLRGYSGR